MLRVLFIPEMRFRDFALITAVGGAARQGTGHVI
jgi:hypothetical protein